MTQTLVEKTYANLHKQKIQKLCTIFAIFVAFVILSSAGDIFADTSFSGTAINLSVDPTDDSVIPRIVVVEDSIHTAWVNGTKIAYSKSTDGGQSFSSPINLGTITGISLPNSLFRLNLVVDGDYVYVIWTNSAAVLLAASSNGGTSFSSATDISSSGTSSTLPSIASDGQIIHIVWRDGDNISYRKSTDGGNTFSPDLSNAPILIGNRCSTPGNPMTCTGSPNPQVGISENDVFVTWQSGANIMFSKSSDGGANFGASATIGSAGSIIASNHELLVDDNSIYTLWKSGSSLLFRKSTDGGENFDSQVTISSSGVSSTSNQRMASFGDNLYIVWSNGADVLFRSSSDGGTTFSPDVANSPTDLSQSSENSFTPELSSYENDVFIAWRENHSAAPTDNDIRFVSSTKLAPLGSNSEYMFEKSLDDLIGGDNSGTAVSGTAAYAQGPIGLGHALSLDGSYHISLANEATFDFDRTSPFSASFWLKTTSSSEQYLIGKSDVIGSTGWSISLSSTGQLRASLSNTDTTNEARTLSDLPAINDGVWHHITVTYDGSSSASGIKTYIDGILRTSSSQSDTLSSSILNDLTASVGGSNSGASKLTGKIDALRIYGKTLSTSDINYLAGRSQTPSFGSIKDVSSNALYASEPKVASGRSSAYVVWSDRTGSSGTDGKIQFKKGTVTNILAQFAESPQYRLSETATLRVVDSSKSGTVTADVTSTTAPAGFTVTLTETGTGTGVFEKQINFITSGTSGGSSLLVSPGDSINLTYGSVSATGSIFPRTVSLPFATYNRGDETYVTVTDQNSNLDPSNKDSITVTISALQSGSAVSLILTETGTNTGVFGSAADTKLIISEENNKFEVNKSIKITLERPDVNNDPATKQSITVTVESEGFTCPCPTGTSSVVLTETDVNSSIFEGTIELSSTDSVAGSKVKVKAGDVLKVTKPSTGSSPISFSNRALIIPTSSSVDLIPVKILDAPTYETITATFGGVSTTAQVQFISGEPGGGGGGLVRPGLVVNALAGASAVNSLFGGGGGNSPPSIKTSSISIFENPDQGLPGIIKTDDNKDIQTSKPNSKKTKVGEPVTIRFNVIESQGKGGVGHVTLYFNENGLDSGDLEKNNFIRFDKFKGVTISDKTGIFSDTNFEIVDTGGTELVLKFDVTFAKKFDSADMMLDVWDIDRRSSREMFKDAIQVDENDQPSEIIQAKQDMSSQDTTTKDADILDNAQISNQQKEIPPWVKTSAGWWAERQVSDNDFVLGLEYLTQKGILVIPKTSVDEQKSQIIPSWVKDTAGWWSSDKISDADFINAVQWLIKKGIMKI